MAIINLYPPVIDSYMPAFLVKQSTIRIYFSISIYNNFSDIKNAQVTISNQYTNISVLDDEKYPCSIMLTPIFVDNTREGNDKYYIEIKNTDIKDGFQINQYYKLQIRFTSIEAQNISYNIPQSIDSWLTTNLSLFSEWSTVCLIRGISTPILEISNFDTDSEYTLWNIGDVDIIGKISFEDSAETDSLSYYRIKLYNDSNVLLLDSKEIYNNNYNNLNDIRYSLNYNFQEGEYYSVVVSFETKNLYKSQEEFKFLIIQQNSDTLNVDVTAAIDKENARTIINIKSIDDSSFYNNLTIRRTSSKTNYTIWEDIYTTEIQRDGAWTLNVYDYTIESGIWYKYCAQTKNSLGVRGVITTATKPIMEEFEYIYLTSENQQIKIKFDANISSLKYNIAESKVDTIGSQFPYIKRNGAMNYRIFPISGTISYLMDEDNIFITREEIYKENLELYEEYNKKNRIDIYTDVILEKEFRDRVTDFLQKNNVKLFRSATEGNILVKLMDINFTPNTVLGRQIYSFSCTAYEIDEFNLKNCHYYKIHNLGDYSKLLSYSSDYLGQINRVYEANEDIVQAIEKEYQKYAHENYVVELEYLDSLKIEMESEPYLIAEGTDGPYIVNDNPRLRSTTPAAAAQLGYLLYINNKPIIINSEGIYQLQGEDVKITSLYSPVDIKFNLDFHIKANQTEDITKIIKSTTYTNKVGQLWGEFKYNDSITNKIFDKYYEKYTSYIQSMSALKQVKIEAEPGTVVYIKETNDKDFQRHLIGNTGTLNIYNDSSTLDNIYFAGIHLEEATEYEKSRETIPDNKYIDTGINIYNLEELESPVKNGVYTFTDVLLNTLQEIEKEEAVLIEEELIDETGEERKSKEVYTDNYSTIEPETIIMDREMIIDSSIYENYELNADTYKKAEITGLEVLDMNEEEEYVELPQEKILKIVNDLYEITGNETTYGIEEASTIKVKGYDKIKDTLYMYFKDMDADKVEGLAQLIVNRYYDKELMIYLEELLTENKYIWYNNKWWLFTKDHDLICPVAGLVDYICEIYKGMYNV